MGTWGFQVGGLAVAVDGERASTSRGELSTAIAPVFRFQVIPTDEALRPSGPATAEQDSWAAFWDGERTSIVHKVHPFDPPEVARLELPTIGEGVEGRLWWRRGTQVNLLTHPIDQLLIIHALDLRGGLLMHGASIGTQRGAFLVCGPSGAGKTTMARAAAELPGARILSDERTIARPTPSGWVVDGTPWPGEGNFALEATLPLRGVMLLEQADEDRLDPISPGRALAYLYRCHFPPFWVPGGSDRALDHLERLVREVPCFRLRNRLGGEAARQLLSRLTPEVAA